MWEAFARAARAGLDNLVAIVDVNRLGQGGETMLGWETAAYAARAGAFGWRASEINGSRSWPARSRSRAELNRAVAPVRAFAKRSVLRTVAPDAAVDVFPGALRALCRTSAAKGDPATLTGSSYDPPVPQHPRRHSRHCEPGRRGPRCPRRHLLATRPQRADHLRPLRGRHPDPAPRLGRQPADQAGRDRRGRPSVATTDRRPHRAMVAGGERHDLGVGPRVPVRAPPVWLSPGHASDCEASFAGDVRTRTSARLVLRPGRPCRGWPGLARGRVRATSWPAR